MSHPRFESILKRFVAWAFVEPTVRSALIVGSQARSITPADQWSDLDVLVLTTDMPKLLDSAEWVERFGPVVLTFLEATSVGDFRERRVLYSDGADVDFAILPAQGQAVVAGHPAAQSVLGRGYEVLIDKDRFWSTVPRSTLSERTPTTTLPDVPAFLATTSDFLYHVLWTARKLRRGEVWTAKLCCDGYLKLRLLRLIEWSVIADSRGRVDTWHSGRFMDDWAPADVRDRLPSTFARYDAADIARALNATVELFGDLGRRLAAQLGTPYPEREEAVVRAMVAETLGAPSPAP
jgi:aminoglycoside 6-adenylyltransferase